MRPRGIATGSRSTESMSTHWPFGGVGVLVLPEPAFNGWLREAPLLIDIAVRAELPVKSVLFGNIPALELSRPMPRQPRRYFVASKFPRNSVA